MQTLQNLSIREQHYWDFGFLNAGFKTATFYIKVACTSPTRTHELTRYHSTLSPNKGAAASGRNIEI